MKPRIIICAIGAVILSWFNWVFLVFIAGLPVSLLSGFKFELFYHIEGAQGQAGMIAWFFSLFPASISIILFVYVFRWYKKEKTPRAKNVWIAFLALFVAVSLINFIPNIRLISH